MWVARLNVSVADGLDELFFLPHNPVNRSALITGPTRDDFVNR